MARPQPLLRYPVQGLNDLGDAVSIDARCPGLGHVAEMISPPVAGKVVGERGARALRCPASCRCYPCQGWCHGSRPAWRWVQPVSPPCVGTVFPWPGACSADPCPLDAALPRSEYSASVRLPTARHQRRAWRTLVSPLPVQRVGCLGSRRLSPVHEGSLVCVLWV
jgi:hypothetical protein